MQIMEGDIMAHIFKHSSHYAHYHTVVRRHELDGSQELYYPAIMEAIRKRATKDPWPTSSSPRGPIRRKPYDGKAVLVTHFPGILFKV